MDIDPILTKQFLSFKNCRLRAPLMSFGNGYGTSRAHDLPPSEIEVWVEDGNKGMENALRANPQDVREQYEKQLKDLQEAYGEAMLELRARKKLQSLLGEDEK